MKSVKLSNGSKIVFKKLKYSNPDNLCIKIYTEDGLPYATLSTNDKGSELGEGEFYVKYWSENESLFLELCGLGVFKDMPRQDGNNIIAKIKDEFFG